MQRKGVGGLRIPPAIGQNCSIHHGGVECSEKDAGSVEARGAHVTVDEVARVCLCNGASVPRAGGGCEKVPRDLRE